LSKEWLLSPEFSEYRQEEMKIGANFIGEIWKGKSSIEYVNGALDMLRKIINLPKSLAGTDEEKALAAAIIERDMQSVENKLLRDAVM
jgi:hypothetical protein